MSKTASQAMEYEVAGTKKASAKGVAVKAAETLSTPHLLWLVVKRHKVALLAIGNVVLVLNWLVPAWPEMLRSLF